MEGEEDFVVTKSKGKAKPEADLASLCEEQKHQIEALQEQLKAKDAELQQLRRTSNAKVESPSPPKPQMRVTKQEIPKVSAAGAEFWDSHLESNEGSDYSFDDIAAKGLWILTSASERKTEPVPAAPRRPHPNFAKQVTTKETFSPVKKPTFTGSPQHPMPKATYGDSSFPRGQEESPRRLPAIQSPQQARAKVQASPPRPVHVSQSPFKSKSLLQALEAANTKNSDFPLSQGYLRMGLKPTTDKSREIQQSWTQPPKAKQQFSPSPSKPPKALSPSPLPKKQPGPGHRKAVSLAQPR
jgi:hypothetical protein